MRVFRKRKKFGNFHGTPADAEHLPDIVYQMGAEAAAQYVAQRSMPQNPYGAINSAEEEAFYDYPHVPIEENPINEISEVEMDERVRVSSPLNFIASAIGIGGRSKHRERYSNGSLDHFVRAGSPDHFRPPGNPVKYRRRPVQLGMVQPRASSPYHFVQQEQVPSPLHFAQQERVPSPLHFVRQPRAASPDVARRLQRAQLSQGLQHTERQQRRQQEMMMNYPAQFIPQYQQAQQLYYPNLTNQAYSMIQQPQMYSYY